ncbi:hypothetical protein JHK86_001881 [Glycine max]|nr:hypothetical protein JHK86_001881 [Glycine max]
MDRRCITKMQEFGLASFFKYPPSLVEFKGKEDLSGLPMSHVRWVEFFIDIMDEDPRAMMFVILWAIWYTRNQHVFQNKRMKVQPLLSKMAFVPLSREDITMAQESNLIPTYGKTPPLGIFKINFDAAMRKEVGTRLGFIVHDSEDLHRQIPAHAFPHSATTGGARQNRRVTNVVTIRFFLKASLISSKPLIEGNKKDDGDGVVSWRRVTTRHCSSAMTGRKGLDWATKDVKVVKIKWRTAKEGLRFFGDAPPALILSNNEKDNKNKEKKEKSEKEKVVRIVGGRDAGLKGNVVFRIGDDYLVLELSRSGEKVKIKVGDVVELGSKEEEMCLRKLKELKT